MNKFSPRVAVVCTALLLLTPAITPAVEWRFLNAPGDFQSMVDLDSVTSTQGQQGQPGLQRFMLRRAFNTPQALPTGQPYRSTRLHYVADCTSGRLITALTAYYGDDRKLVHSEQRTQVRRSEFAAPDAADVAEAMNVACPRPNRRRAATPVAPASSSATQARC
jgi:hypothetical protein